MGFFQRLRDRFAESDNGKRSVVAGGVIVGLITITGTQVAQPDSSPEGGCEGFPEENCVGPAIDPTVTYEGDCNFSSSDDGLIVDSRIVDCETEGLRFAAGTYTVTFRNSIIRGQMFTFQYTPGDTGADTYPRAPIFVVEDSDILQTQTANGQDRAVCCSHFVVERSYLQGGHSVMASHNNGVIRDSFLTTDGTSTHQSGMRILKNSIVDGNTIVCKPAYLDPDDGGCSAAAVFYSEDLTGASAAAFNLDITGNYFKRGTVGETGILAGPYNATRFIDCENRVDCVDIHFTDNQIDLGWGVDAGEFPLSYGGNTWSGNVWTDGQPATSGQVR
jgi:hypothetical protein